MSKKKKQKKAASVGDRYTLAVRRKAVQEVRSGAPRWQVAKALGASAATVGMWVRAYEAALIESLLGEPCKVAGGMLADQVYAWRWRNRIRIANRAAEILAKSNTPAAVLPPGFLVPLLDRAGDVDDAELQDLWAQLLASSVANPRARHTGFVNILTQVSRDEAVILRATRTTPCRTKQAVRVQRSNGRILKFENPEHDFPVAQLQHPENMWAYLHHLESLGLLHEHEGPRVTPAPGVAGEKDDVYESAYAPSIFGQLFLEACAHRASGEK